MRKKTVLAVIVPALIGAAIAAVSIYLVRTYGGALFFGVPSAIGFVSTAILRKTSGPQTRTTAVGVALCAGVGMIVGFLVFGWEGFLCILMAIPLALPLVILGALVAWELFHRYDVETFGPSALFVLAIVALIPIEARFQHPARGVVADSVLVRASPRETWRAIVALDRIPQPHDWIYRAGIACPQRTRIVTPAANGIRVCKLSTGIVIEQIEVWKPEQMLRWHTQSSPAPMKELNPFHDQVDAPHLHGYYELPRGEFALAPAASNSTILTRRSWYTHDLAPAWYWRWWCEFAITHVHRTVLEHVRDAAESKGARS
jgi:hypothetical protein